MNTSDSDRDQGLKSAESSPGLAHSVDLEQFPLEDESFIGDCRQSFEQTGALALNGFAPPSTVARLVDEAASLRSLAYFTDRLHTVYLEEPQSDRPEDDARSWGITSTKGAVTTDQIPDDSDLHIIYDSPVFRRFLAKVLGEEQLFSYADPVSSININYYETSQELGWHFDNSSFSITLLTQEPKRGGQFQFINAMRNTRVGDQNYAGVADTLRTGGAPQVLSQAAGDLVIFRGRETLHRVTPVEGEQARILTVFAYNTEPDLALSENARMTFFGRLG